MRVSRRASDWLELVRTPVGRERIARHIRVRAWPLYRGAAGLHRRLVLRGTPVVAVVGTFGKSTTARALRLALNGDPGSERAPNSFTRLARVVLRARPRHGVLVAEAGIDAPGQMRSYARMLRPDLVVVTSVGSEHHRSLGTLERTRDEKAEMVRSLGPDQTVFLNGDDENVGWMATQTRARIVRFGRAPHHDVVAERVELDWPHGTRLAIRMGDESLELRVRLLGEKMAYPILAALAVARALGRPREEVARALEALTPMPGRLETVALPNGAFLVRDDFKSALETIDAALDVMEAIPARRKWIVMGDVSEPPGSQGPIYRRIGERMGRIGARVITVGHAHSPLAAGYVRSGHARAGIRLAAGSAEAARMLDEELDDGDVVLVKGRDTQKLDRVSLRLQGMAVGCELAYCDVSWRCASCPMRERGFQAR